MRNTLSKPSAREGEEMSDDLVQRLRDNAQGEGMAIFDEAADALAYLEAQDGLLSKAQDECQRLRDELAETKRPLDAQMVRLNANLITANEEIARLRAALERIADPRNIHFAGDARVVATQALNSRGALPKATAHTIVAVAVKG